MLELRYLMDHSGEARAALARRSEADAALLDPIVELDARRRELIARTEAMQAERNAASKEMARMDKKSEAFAARRELLRELGSRTAELSRLETEIEAEVQDKLARLPNLPDASVPDGAGEADNVVVKSWGEPRPTGFAAKPHYDLGPELGLVDFARAAKLSGPRFTVLFGAVARLERALIQLMLDVHTGDNGYTEVLPPFLVKGEALFGTGQLPKFEKDLFKTQKSDPDKTYDLYLGPTAEVALTNLHAGEILEQARLPVAYAAYTPCFRSEAGSYGQDVRGMIRQHQFNKVELVRLCTPETSGDELEQLTSHAEGILERLGLAYRRVALCAGDLGFGAVKTYDLEVWLPSQERYREISSCSNCGDFQARRAKIRYRPEGLAKGKPHKPRLVHTLNGSGLAVGRTVVAILEQYQRPDGTVDVPAALAPYMGGVELITPRG